MILAAADVATCLFAPLPGMANNSANKFFDALAASRPLAINYGGWHADLLREYGAGLVLDRDDVEGSAAALTALLHDPARLASARTAARSLAEERFSRDALFDVFERVVVGPDPERESRAVPGPGRAAGGGVPGPAPADAGAGRNRDGAESGSARGAA
jgi:hypothetical protein